MRRRSTNYLIFSLVLLSVTGCARNYAPDYWLPTEIESQRSAFGGWAHVEWGHGKIAEGELIAVTSDSLFLMTEVALSGLALDEVTFVRVASHTSAAYLLGMWTLLGTLSTGSHGVGLLFSAPVWIIAGSAATAAQTRAPLTSTHNPLMEWGVLSMYARFPQGIPPNVDRANLRPKPIVGKY